MGNATAGGSYPVAVTDSAELATDRRAGWSHRVSPGVALAVICVIHGLLPLILIGVHHGLGIDETVYVTQYNGHVPPGIFSAPRSRGVPFLVAPITSWSTSVGLLRLYLAVLAALGLYVGLRPWQRLRPGWAVPLAAVVFSSLWVTIYYSDEAMPNEWVAYGALAATGLTLSYHQRRARSDLVGIFVALAVVALFRPIDGLWLGAVLVVSIGVLPGLRRSVRLGAAGVIVAGLAAGWADWVVEAFTSYGGLTERIHAAQAQNGGGGIQFAFAAQARALGGPLLCRYGCRAHTPIVLRLWWVAIPILVACAVVAAHRAHELRWVLVPAVAGVAILVEYTVSVGYAAPRFLIPAYALLALPCAEGLLWLVQQMPRRLTIASGAVVAGLIVAQFVSQSLVLSRDIDPGANDVTRTVARQARVLQARGVRAPCSVPGILVNQLAYQLRCGNRPHDPAVTHQEIQRGIQVVRISDRRPDPAQYWSAWPTIRIPAHMGQHFASISPRG
jgi:hypothetical protein